MVGVPVPADLVLLHGFTQTGRSWDAVRERLGERLDPVALDAIGERLVGGAAQLALRLSGQARARAQEDEPGEAPGSREREVQGDPAAHRVARERRTLRDDLVEIREDRREVDRPPPRRVAVPAQVRRVGAVAFAEPLPHGVPAAPGLGEAVEEDEVGGH